MNEINVLIADDHALIRDGIIAMLKNEGDIRIIGEAVDGEEAIVKNDELNPDVIIMDIMMPKFNGLEAAKMIKEKHPEAKIIFLSMEVKEDFISEAIKSGASGYIPKEQDYFNRCDPVGFSGRQIFSQHGFRADFPQVLSKVHWR